MITVEVIDNARDILNEPLSSGRTFPDNSSGFWGDTTLLRYFNLAQTEVAQEIIQTFEDFFLTDTSLNISAGVARYSLPSDFVKMRKVEDNRNPSAPVEVFPIRLNDTSHWGTLDAISSVGFNGGYRIENSSIVFDSTPTFTQNSSVKMYYIKRIADIISATDTSDLPAETHRALVWGIVKYAQFQQQADNQFAAVEFEKHLRKIREQAENRQIQTPRRVFIRNRRF